MLLSSAKIPSSLYNIVVSRILESIILPKVETLSILTSKFSGLKFKESAFLSHQIGTLIS